jgi:hypothetical protein
MLAQDNTNMILKNNIMWSAQQQFYDGEHSMSHAYTSE